MNYRIIPLPNGEKIQIKFDEQGVVYDRLDKNDNVLEEYGYDFYYEVLPFEVPENTKSAYHCESCSEAVLSVRYDKERDIDVCNNCI